MRSDLQTTLSSRFPRRTAIATGLAAAGIFARPVQVRAAPAAADALTILAADRVYFEATGHTVSGPFWHYWRQFGLDAFGYPITEAHEDGGTVNQYFQRARFELAPNGAVRLGLLGVEAGATEPPPSPPVEDGPDTRVIPETGHAVSGAFLAAYSHLRPILGPPIGAEKAVPGGYIQYFANGRLEWDPFGGTRLGLLGAEIAEQRQVDTTPVPAPPDAVTFSDYLYAAAADEAERRAFGQSVTGYSNFVPGFGEKWILVSIPRQRIYAYEHTRQVFTDLCSTGAAHKGLSTRGIFAINRRVANEVMDSTTIGYPRGHPKYYRLENVLYTQYYNGGEALHYAWWHNNFGYPMSYGCINLRLTTARWFWDWATFGTRVIVS